MSTATAIDIQQVVTDKLIALIERDELPPWQRPWDLSSDGMMPYNHSTNAYYNGINILILWMESEERGYTRNAWLTYKQGKALGGQVIKGEKSTKCVFFKHIEIDDDKGGDDPKIIPCRRVFPLFNVSQFEGLELPEIEKRGAYTESNDNVDECILALANYCRHELIEVIKGGNAAYYTPSSDNIHLPTDFHTAESCAAVLSHECIHSTGHASRLDRFSDQKVNFSMKSEAYAFEELVAELGAAFFCAKFNVQGRNEQHASYLKIWLERLKGDKTFLFKASAAANKAFQLISNAADEQSVANAEDAKLAAA